MLTGGSLISAGGNNNIVSGAWSGTGTLNLSLGSSTFTINASLDTNFTGTILLNDASVGTFRFNSGGSASGAQVCTGSPVATFDLGNSSSTLLNRNGGGSSFGTYFLGALAGGANTIVKGSANSSSASTYQIGDKGLSTTYAGSIQNGAGGTGATVSILKVGPGTFSLSGNNNTYTGSTIISNGVLALTQWRQRRRLYRRQRDDQCHLRNFSRCPPAAATARSRSTPARVLTGRGTILGKVDSSFGGTIVPGGNLNGDTGILTATNSINLGGTTIMKLNRTNTLNSDRLVSSFSTITYGGTLVLTNIGAEAATGRYLHSLQRPVFECQ